MLLFIAGLCNVGDPAILSFCTNGQAVNFLDIACSQAYFAF